MKKSQYFYFYFSTFFQFMINISLLVGICWSLYEAFYMGSYLFALLFSFCLTTVILIHSSEIHVCYISDTPKPHMTKYGLYYYRLEHDGDKDKYVLSIYRNMFFFFSKVVEVSFCLDSIDDINIFDEIDRVAYTQKIKIDKDIKMRKISKEKDKKKKEEIKKNLNKAKNIDRKDNFEEQISKL